MHPEMLHLAHRLVIAMETMSKDVKDMSGYVYDLSCSVSYFSNGNREKQEADHEGRYSAAAQEASAERKYYGQYGHVDETSSLNNSNLEHRESSFADVAPMYMDPHGNSDVLSSVPVFTEGIEIEKQAGDEVSEESYFMHTMYGNNQNSDQFWREVKSEALSETDEQDEAYSMDTTISSPPVQLTQPPALLETASSHMWQENQHVENSTYSAVNSDYTTHITGIPEEDTRTHQAENADYSSPVHVKLTRGEKLHKGSVCENSFGKSSELQSHTQVHTGERPYKCIFCGERFTLNSTLIHHLGSHTGERSYQCNTCGKTFAKTNSLIHHMRTHTGKRPYKCNICGNEFQKSSHLTSHIRCHTGQKPYICNLCGKACTQRGNLNRHMRSHARERP